MKPEILEEKLVTYTLEMDGKFYIVENVPARVDKQTGETYFSPATVENLQRIVRAKQPKRVMETPVFEFA